MCCKNGDVSCPSGDEDQEIITDSYHLRIIRCNEDDLCNDDTAIFEREETTTTTTTTSTTNINERGN